MSETATTTDRVHTAATEDRNVHCTAFNSKGYHRVRVTVRGGGEYTFDTTPNGNWYAAYHSGWGGAESSDYPHQVTDPEFLAALQRAVDRRAQSRGAR